MRLPCGSKYKHAEFIAIKELTNIFFDFIKFSFQLHYVKFISLNLLQKNNNESFQSVEYDLCANYLTNVYGGATSI